MFLNTPSRIRDRALSTSRAILVALFTTFVGTTQATDGVKCSTAPDTYVGNSEASFRIGSWMSRGICIRSHHVDAVCYPTLLAVLENLNQLRQAKYNGAAGVLSLLPTIGALLGAPTSEIWRLLTIVPFGGGLAMALSFGGAMMPVRVEDYESAPSRQNTFPDSVISLRNTIASLSYSEEETDAQKLAKLDELSNRIESRVGEKTARRLPKGHLYLGLLGIVLLFIGAHVAMVVVEQGGVIPWWCVSRWWMHLWYFLVTFAAIIENWTQLPFKNQWSMYISNVAYEVQIAGGEAITEDQFASRTMGENVGIALDQLSTIQPAKVTFPAASTKTASRNSVFLMVSVATGDSHWVGSFWRLLSKSVSICIFVTGTAIFASVTLLALPMAAMTLTLVLAAGVFSRAIASWMVSRVAETEPMIHVIAENDEDAHQVIARIFRLTAFQVEIRGHVFVQEKRVASRSPWYVRLLGVMAEPFDLRNLNKENGTRADTTVETGLMADVV